MQASVGTPLTPPEPGQGPPCGCGDPTVLTDVNGRKLYVCQRWPHHHCSSWCPAEVALVPLRPATAGATEAAATDEEPASPKALQPPPASQQDGAVDSAENGQAEPASPLPQADAENAEEAEEGQTPSQELRTPHVPAAPSKSSSSLERRQQHLAAAQRSLVPLFDRFSPAAIRAAQLGANFVTLRREARLVASMQQAASVSPAAAGPGVAPAARKRSRTPSSDPRPPAASRPRQPLQELVLTASGSSVRRPVAAPSLAAAPALQPPEGGAASWLRSAARPPRF